MSRQPYRRLELASSDRLGQRGVNLKKLVLTTLAVLGMASGAQAQIRSIEPWFATIRQDFNFFWPWPEMRTFADPPPWLTFSGRMWMSWPVGWPHVLHGVAYDPNHVPPYPFAGHGDNGCLRLDSYPGFYNHLTFTGTGLYGTFTRFGGYYRSWPGYIARVQFDFFRGTTYIGRVQKDVDGSQWQWIGSEIPSRYDKVRIHVVFGPLFLDDFRI